MDGIMVKADNTEEIGTNDGEEEMDSTVVEAEDIETNDGEEGKYRFQ